MYHAKIQAIEQYKINSIIIHLYYLDNNNV